MWVQSAPWKKNWNFRLLWPFSEALAIIFAISFLELEEKSAMTAETPLSMLVLIRGVLAEAFSDQLNPGTQHIIFS